MVTAKVRIGGKEVEAILVKSVIKQERVSKRGNREYRWTQYRLQCTLPRAFYERGKDNGFVIICASDCDEVSESG